MAANATAPTQAELIRYGAPEAAKTNNREDDPLKCNATPAAPASAAVQASKWTPTRNGFTITPDTRTHRRRNTYRGGALEHGFRFGRPTPIGLGGALPAPFDRAS
ncbi:hypothetical protein ACXGR9_11370 [Nocardia asiatica]|uniref:hypothetical protein n=1 Tax=Nocardia asiatica TaxID=209252 RepID=UPI00245425C4|nr:hypothetical protein [Nocardia asiatica]